MPNQRHPDQRLVAFALDQELLAALDVARKASGMDRSSYIRHAIADKLQAPASMLKDAPDRTGPKPKPKAVTSYRQDRKSMRK